MLKLLKKYLYYLFLSEDEKNKIIATKKQLEYYQYISNENYKIFNNKNR